MVDPSYQHIEKHKSMGDVDGTIPDWYEKCSKVSKEMFDTILSLIRPIEKEDTMWSMIKSVPLNIPDSDIESDIHQLNNAATIY